MKTVLQIIEAAGGLATFTWTRIENPPFMLLVIESLGEPGPNGHRALSIAHYGEQNGDAAHVSHVVRVLAGARNA